MPALSACASSMAAAGAPGRRCGAAAATALLLALALANTHVAAALAPPNMGSSLRHSSSSSSSSQVADASASLLGGETGLDDLYSGSGGSGAAPRAIRLALGDSDDEMVVMWSAQAVADQACVQLYAAAQLPPDGLQAAAARLLAGWDGTSGGSSGATSSGRGGGGSASAEPEPPPAVQTVCGSTAPFVEPATGEASQQLYTVVLRGLAPGQHYHYRCGSDAGGWSAWRTFRAKRSMEQVSAADPVRLVAAVSPARCCVPLPRPGKSAATCHVARAPSAAAHDRPVPALPTLSSFYALCRSSCCWWGTWACTTP